jgi:hypothetical protein
VEKAVQGMHQNNQGDAHPDNIEPLGGITGTGAEKWLEHCNSPVAQLFAEGFRKFLADPT